MKKIKFIHKLKNVSVTVIQLLSTSKELSRLALLFGFISRRKLYLLSFVDISLVIIVTLHGWFFFRSHNAQCLCWHNHRGVTVSSTF